MKIAVLGTGDVGRTVGAKLIEVGHSVFMGSREERNDRAQGWVRQNGSLAQAGTFEQAAAFGKIIINATAGSASLQALKAAGSQNLDGKLLIDVANRLVPSGGGRLPNVDLSGKSLAEEIQKEFPNARVVKTLNTVTAAVMVNPDLVKGKHTVFISGDDYQAKTQVTELLNGLGWGRDRIIDLGDISSARGAEGYVQLWIGLYQALGTPHFNIQVTQSA